MREVAVIGLGEAGTAIAGGPQASGAATVRAYDVPMTSRAGTSQVRGRAAEAGIEVAATLDDALTGATIVFSLVTPSSARQVSHAAAEFLTEGQLFLDANSGSPGLMRAVADAIADSGADMVDVAIIAAVSPKAHRAPMLASGPRAGRAAQLLAPTGMSLQVIGDQPGTA